MSRFSSNDSNTRFISIVICVCIYVPSPRVGIVTSEECRATAQRYVSHAAQMPCVTTTFLLAAGVGCNALPESTWRQASLHFLCSLVVGAAE